MTRSETRSNSEDVNFNKCNVTSLILPFLALLELFLIGLFIRDPLSIYRFDWSVVNKVSIYWK